jgi:YgiT-type zinc finger domain-containing protein
MSKQKTAAKNNKPEVPLPCTECQAGQMHRQYVTYYTYLGEELISVPDFPAWVCDVCGRREYDPNALNRLSLILSPTAGTTTLRKRLLPSKKDISGKSTRLDRSE